MQRLDREPIKAALSTTGVLMVGKSFVGHFALWRSATWSAWPPVCPGCGYRLRPQFEGKQMNPFLAIDWGAVGVGFMIFLVALMLVYLDYRDEKKGSQGRTDRQTQEASKSMLL